MTEYITATQMVWRPPLIALHQITSPRIDDGQLTPVYVDPGELISIYRSRSRLPMREGEDGSPDPLVSCTIVVMRYGSALAVTETPEQVASMRNDAFGLPPSLKSV